MTFREFLARTHAHDTPVGDFIRDARAHRHLPESFTSLNDLHRHMGLHACREARDAAAIVWRRYRRMAR